MITFKQFLLEKKKHKKKKKTKAKAPKFPAYYLSYGWPFDHGINDGGNVGDSNS
jgi:hypothetical protein